MANRIVLDDVTSLPDFLSTDTPFRLSFGTIPNVAGLSSLPLSIKVQQTVLPGVANQKVEFALHSFKVYQSGLREYTHTLPCILLEDRTMHTLNCLRRWSELVKGTKTANSDYKSNYTITAALEFMDQTDTIIESITLRNFWPTNVPDITFEGTNSTALLVNVDFGYDWWESSNVTMR